jgi:hypothetical protein
MLAAFLLMFSSTEVVGLTERAFLLVILAWLLVASGWFARAHEPASPHEAAVTRVTSTAGREAGPQ